MKSIKGTQTEKNLLTSFAGESQARMRYTYFASQAKKDGYEQISAIFTETADQEKEHAKRMFKFLEGGMVEITASYPAGVIGTTLENLRAAAAGEHEEWSLDYPKFADSSATSRRARSSHAMRKRYGSAATADTSSSAKRRLRLARLASTRRHTSNSRKRICNSRHNGSENGLGSNSTAKPVFHI